MTKYLLAVLAVLVAACADPATSRTTQELGNCPSNPPMRCRANLWSSDDACTIACSEEVGADTDAYCPEITQSEMVGCDLLCAGIPNVPPDYEHSACINRCYSLIFHNCVGGRLP